MRFSRKVLKIFTIFLTALAISYGVVAVISIKNQDLERLIKLYRTKSPLGHELAEFSYTAYMMNVPSGKFQLKIQRVPYQGQAVGEAYLTLRPLGILRKFSNIGIDFRSVFNEDSLLPYTFELTSPWTRRKGKAGRTIEYCHNELGMVRKNRKEDIEQDTRDPLSLIAWLMSQDYEKTDLLKSTLNINRDIYTVVGKVVLRSSLADNGRETRFVRLKLKILGLDAGYNLKSQFPVEVYLVQRGVLYVPVLFRIQRGGFLITVALSSP